jgi:hypothetical protein
MCRFSLGASHKGGLNDVKNIIIGAAGPILTPLLSFPTNAHDTFEERI